MSDRSPRPWFRRAVLGECNLSKSTVLAHPLPLWPSSGFNALKWYFLIGCTRQGVRQLQVDLWSLLGDKGPTSFV